MNPENIAIFLKRWPCLFLPKYAICLLNLLQTISNPQYQKVPPLTKVVYNYRNLIELEVIFNKCYIQFDVVYARLKY